ncbi:MAG: carbohydrate ABC transporter permease [Chloroflexi bacterium]|nr:carbohydrate ABC transporter permease [Chloroflexota bacterium]
MSSNPRPSGWATQLGALVVVFLIAVPFLWMVSTSLKAPAEISLRDPTWVPREPDLDNYVRVIVDAQFGRYFVNTLIVTAATTSISVAFATLAGYAFARLKLRGGKPLLLGILATQMFPGILLAIPLYVLLQTLGLIDTLGGLVLVYTSFALPFGVWMMRNYFLTVPRELEDAALVDGCSRLGALWLVALPVVAPGVTATAIFTSILAWNEFLYANTFINTAANRTLSIALQSLIGEFTTDWGQLMAGAVVTTLPIVLLFFVIQRNLTQGLAAGSVKG